MVLKDVFANSPAELKRPLSKKFDCGRFMMRTTCDDKKLYEFMMHTKPLNPFFTSVISFGKCEEDMPTVSYEQQGETLQFKIEFNDGYSEFVAVERFATKVLSR